MPIEARGIRQLKRIKATGAESGTLVPCFRLAFPFLASRKRSELFRLMARLSIEAEVLAERDNPESAGNAITEEMAVWGTVESLRQLAHFVDSTPGIISELWTRPIHVSSAGSGAERVKSRFEKLNKSQQTAHSYDSKYQSRQDKIDATDKRIREAIAEMEGKGYGKFSPLEAQREAQRKPVDCGEVIEREELLPTFAESFRDAMREAEAYQTLRAGWFRAEIARVKAIAEEVDSLRRIAECLR